MAEEEVARFVVGHDNTSKLKHISIRWRLLVVRLFLAEGEVHFSRHPSGGCCTKFRRSGTGSVGFLDYS